MGASGTITFEDRDGVRIVRIARPEKKNALTVEMYAALAEALQSAEADDGVHVVSIRGAPGVFTAGNDLADFMGRPPTGEDHPVFRFLMALVQGTRPLVAAVDGPAIGIGTTMLLHCDLVVATPTTRFQLPFVPLGLVPEGGSSLLLPDLVGAARASEWLLLGQPFSAQDAKDAGLVNRVVPAENLDLVADELCAALAGLPQGALRASRALLREPRAERLTTVMRREAAAFVARLSSPEAAEAFARFFQRKS